jgi:O-antigen ligase
VSGQWRRRVFRRGDVAGAIVAAIPMLLLVYDTTGIVGFQIAGYLLALAVVVPCLTAFIGSLQRSATGLSLVLLFVALAMSMLAAFYVQPSMDVWLQAKGFAATAVWASIYVVVFVIVQRTEDANRVAMWVDGVCLIISTSVWAGALLHLAGIPFGEVIDAGTTFRAFGPLGDQVGFVVVLPALTSLLARRPVRFGFHLSAVLLTGTRGALLCLLVGVIGLFVLRLGTNRSRRRQLAAVVVVGILLWFMPMSAALRERFLQPSMRQQAFEAGIEVVRKSPLIGVGFNGLDSNRSAAVEDWTMPAQAANGLSRASNQYIQTAVDGGVVALLMLILFVSFGTRDALRVMRWPAATPELVASQLWLIAIFIGNQASLWLLANTANGFFVFAVAGLAAKASDLSRAERL